MGLSTSDDAGVYRLSDTVALVQTVDFFTPIVDDPYIYGQIAAANALSDVYAMGGTPLTAMNIFCYPINSRDPEEAGEILRGGAEKLAEAGVALVGGHSVDDPEPKYGLSVTGTVHPDHIATNAGAQSGDLLVITKPVGTGILVTAARADGCAQSDLDHACSLMRQLNAPVARVMQMLGVGADAPIHAATDITGFGVVGHLFQMAKASGKTVRLYSSKLPSLEMAEQLAAMGYTTAGAVNNMKYVADQMRVDAAISVDKLALFTDPQTSGGIVLSVNPQYVETVLSSLQQEGTEIQQIVGEVCDMGAYALEIKI